MILAPLSLIGCGRASKNSDAINSSADANTRNSVSAAPSATPLGSARQLQAQFADHTMTVGNVPIEFFFSKWPDVVGKLEAALGKSRSNPTKATQDIHHFFDESGILVRVESSTQRILGVSFCFAPLAGPGKAPATNEPRHVFRGAVKVNDISLDANSTPDSLIDDPHIEVAKDHHVGYRDVRTTVNVTIGFLKQPRPPQQLSQITFDARGDQWSKPEAELGPDPPSILGHNETVVTWEEKPATPSTPAMAKLDLTSASRTQPTLSMVRQGNQHLVILRGILPPVTASPTAASTIQLTVKCGNNQPITAEWKFDPMEKRTCVFQGDATGFVRQLTSSDQMWLKEGRAGWIYRFNTQGARTHQTSLLGN
ncbi:MAG: hypothetical protein U1A77_08780 [Pirellulales bacterium]